MNEMLVPIDLHSIENKKKERKTTMEVNGDHHGRCCEVLPNYQYMAILVYFSQFSVNQLLI